MATIKTPVFSTDQIAISKFRKHGRVEYDPHGRLLLTSATGPFNAELIAALRELAIITFPNMALLGSWAQCVVFHESAMGGADVLAGLAELLKDLANMGVAPAATAFVLPPGVEGASIMAPLWELCYKAANMRFAAFEQSGDAAAWISACLDAAPAIPGSHASAPPLDAASK